MSGFGAEGLTRHQHLIDRLRGTGTDTVVVIGRHHDDARWGVWEGAVLSVSGGTQGLPTVAQAIESGLFEPGTGFYLVPWRPADVSPERVEDAKARTARLVHFLQTGQAPDSRQTLPKASLADDLPAAQDRAESFARDVRLKFERVYGSARKALAAGDQRAALQKCMAALELLRGADIYGADQTRIADALENRIEQLRG